MNKLQSIILHVGAILGIASYIMLLFLLWQLPTLIKIWSHL